MANFEQQNNSVDGHVWIFSGERSTTGEGGAQEKGRQSFQTELEILSQFGEVIYTSNTPQSQLVNQCHPFGFTNYLSEPIYSLKAQKYSNVLPRYNRTC